MVFKVCNKCDLNKSIENFYPVLGKKGKTYYSGRCKKCHRAINHKREKENPEVTRLWQRKSRLKKKYGISLEDYNKLLKDQNEKCAICYGKPEYKLYVDHDHKTGLVRGLLCHWCNFAIGLARDSSSILKNAIKYLDKYSSVGDLNLK